MPWINLCGAGIVVLLLIPNIIYALRHGGEENLCKSRLMNILEQVGRYGSMVFLIIPIDLNGQIGFRSVAALLCYGFGSLILLAAYYGVWIAYFHVRKAGNFRAGEKDAGKAVALEKAGDEKKGRVCGGVSAVFVTGRENVRRIGRMKMALAILPSCLFLLCGITLSCILLILSAAFFAVGHIYVTRENLIRSIHTGERI